MTTRVVVVDDQEVVRAAFGALLATQPDFTVVGTAADGAQAVRAAAREAPRLVFLDIDMPVLDGIEACRQMRAVPAMAGAKIVMLTASADDRARSRAADAGADRFLTKPFSPLDLLRLVDELA